MNTPGFLFLRLVAQRILTAAGVQGVKNVLFPLLTTAGPGISAVDFLVAGLVF